jgi:hypothetical protein
MLYVDTETEYKIREINFNDRREVELYVKASNAVQEEIVRCGGKACRYPLLLAAFSVGQAMRFQHLKRPKTRFYIIFDKEDNPVAIGECFSAVKDSPFKGKELYPIFHLFQFKNPFTKELVEAYKAFSRMLKQQGYTEIYCHIPQNHKLLNWLPVKKKIGKFLTLWDLLELNI